jgi:sodium/proline symporter
VLWLAFFSSTGLYEIIPGFIVGLIAAVIVTLCGKGPGADVEALFDKYVALKD